MRFAFLTGSTEGRTSVIPVVSKISTDYGQDVLGLLDFGLSSRSLLCLGYW